MRWRKACTTFPATIMRLQTGESTRTSRRPPPRPSLTSPPLPSPPLPSLPCNTFVCQGGGVSVHELRSVQVGASATQHTSLPPQLPVQCPRPLPQALRVRVQPPPLSPLRPTRAPHALPQPSPPLQPDPNMRPREASRVRRQRGPSGRPTTTHRGGDQLRGHVHGCCRDAGAPSRIRTLPWRHFAASPPLSVPPRV